MLLSELPACLRGKLYPTGTSEQVIAVFDGCWRRSHIVGEKCETQWTLTAMFDGVEERSRIISQATLVLDLWQRYR
jgi:hypothetical protein